MRLILTTILALFYSPVFAVQYTSIGAVQNFIITATNTWTGDQFFNGTGTGFQVLNNEIIQGTSTIQGNAFSVGASSFVVSGGSVTIGGPAIVNGQFTATAANSKVSTATQAGNLNGGANGTIPYQSAANTTAMLSAGTAGYILSANGAAAPSWLQAFQSSFTYNVCPSNCTGTNTTTFGAALTGSTLTFTTDGNLTAVQINLVWSDAVATNNLALVQVWVDGGANKAFWYMGANESVAADSMPITFYGVLPFTLSAASHTFALQFGQTVAGTWTISGGLGAGNNSASFGVMNFP